MTLHLPRALADELLRAAIAAGEQECCGLLLGRRDGEHATVERGLPMENVAAAPRREFLLDPAAVARALRDARGGGPDVVGVYHSHPRSPALPSPRDAAEAWPEWSFVIVGASAAGREVRSFRRATAGAPLVDEPLFIV